jgi:hypothetical protein
MKVFDWKYTSIAIGLIVGFILTQVFYSEVLYSIKFK